MPGATREALAVLLVERYGLDGDRAVEDVDRFIASLLERNLLDVSDD